jgi:DNA-binding PadR family transcriptional regulator
MDPDKIPSPRELQLLSLVVTERNGREVAKLFEEEMGERIPYGTVYTVFAQLERAGWVRIRDQRDGDRRVRLIQLTAPGKRALATGISYYRRLADFGEAARGFAFGGAR